MEEKSGDRRSCRTFLEELLEKKVTSEQAQHLVKPITAQEVKQVFFSLNSNKAPGPDGFSAHFYKSTWSIVGNDVV